MSKRSHSAGAIMSPGGARNPGTVGPDVPRVSKEEFAELGKKLRKARMRADSPYGSQAVKTAMEKKELEQARAKIDEDERKADEAAKARSRREEQER